MHVSLYKDNKIVSGHTTNGPPTIDPQGQSAATMDGHPGRMHGCHTWYRGPSMALSISTLGPP